MVAKVVKQTYSIVEGTIVGLPLVKYWLNKSGNEVHVSSKDGIRQIKEVSLEMEFENPQFTYFRQTSEGIRDDGSKIYKYLLKQVASAE